MPPKRGRPPAHGGSSGSAGAIVAQSTPIPSVHRELVQNAGTKCGLVQTLKSLHQAGLLSDAALGGSAKNVKRKLQTAIEAHAKTQTPYGKVVKTMRVDLPDMQFWEYCDPMALIWHLCNISPAFADVMAACVTPGVPLRIVIYVDECEPGNPYRPEKSRCLQCIYWCFADWPQWLVPRTAAWPVFGVMTSSHTSLLPGGLADLMRRVLLTFFPSTGHSFLRGICIQRGDRHMHTMIKAIFAGFLADEKAHKELGDLKGASGSNLYGLVCAVVGGASSVG